MDLVSMAKEMLQNVAEHLASYRIGQTALRCCDRALWVVEKCARWAVPPPLDQDERPQPELIRPLPWIFFLSMLIMLRVMRETISLANLVMGKPPLRSADVVIYLQSKRRYLRTLKYQGNRIMRARTSSAQSRNSWYHGLRSVFEFTMCFRRSAYSYGNNNTTSISNNEEVLVVKRIKRGREDVSSIASSSAESTMERLIEKMMVDLNDDSDEDSSCTLTNVAVAKSETSEVTIESDQGTLVNKSSSVSKSDSETLEKTRDEHNFTPNKDAISSTPEKVDDSEPKKEENSEFNKESLFNKESFKPKDEENSDPEDEENSTSKKEETSKPEYEENFELSKEEYTEAKKELTSERKKEENEIIAYECNEDTSGDQQKLTLEQDLINFMQNESCPQRVQRSPKPEKFANGRTTKSVSGKKKGSHVERRDIQPTASKTPPDNK